LHLTNRIQATNNATVAAETPTSYYLHDGQGSVRALADDTGAITDQYTYTAFGEMLGRQGTTENPYLYTGQRFDELTGLYQLRARYYDPTGGRFLSRDPFEDNIIDPKEINRYVYAANNPVNLVDPTGQSALGEGALIRAVNGAMCGAVTGFVSGFAIALIFYTVSKIGACGDLMQAWAWSLTPAELDTYIVTSALIGMAVGAGSGALATIAPVVVSIATTAIGGIGMVISGYDIITNKPNGDVTAHRLHPE
jgi:RHS repeat-associated protein